MRSFIRDGSKLAVVYMLLALRLVILPRDSKVNYFSVMITKHIAEKIFAI